MLAVVIIGCIAGIFSGLIAGLFGLGGGVIIVPTILFILPHFIDIPHEYSLFIAIGSAFVTIISTSISSTYKHIKLKDVRYKETLSLVISLSISTFILSFLFVNINPGILKIFFGMILLYSALKMLLEKSNNNNIKIKENTAISNVLAGSSIGALSASGIGSGSFLVTYLVKRGFSIHQAIGTSSFCSVFISISGTLSYIIIGYHVNTGLNYSTGYLFWPIIISVAIVSFIFAQIGATISSKLSVYVMKKVFSIFLIFISLNIIYAGIEYIYHYGLHLPQF